MGFLEKPDWPDTSYDSKINNIVTEFFIPALAESTTYRRIGGLFSSSSFALCARGIKELIANEGKMQLIISPILSKEDAKAIRDASSDVVQNVIEKSINRELDSIESEFEKDHVGALSYLLKKEFLEIRIDIPKDENGNPLDSETIIDRNILAEKRGIFQDRDGNAISFRGPVNATRESWEKGIFSITVDVSWIPGQKQHVLDDDKIFEELWEKSDTIKLPEKLRKEISRTAPEKDDIHLEQYNVPPWAILPNGGKLWDNQIRAVNAWVDNNFRGIFTIATAGGKTLASLAGASLTPKNMLILIVVHGLELVTQWEKEIRTFDPKANLTICDSKHNWNNLTFITSQFYGSKEKREFKNRFYVLANDATASGVEFLKFFKHIDPQNVVFIADEVHHLGAPAYQNVLTVKSNYRLGLSATFVRQWDKEGTQAIQDYFGRELLEAKYSIKEGIRDGRLCQYLYHPFFATLEQDEFDKFYELTLDIASLLSKIKKDDDPKLEKDLQVLNSIRADIIKKAKNKINAYKNIIKERPHLPYVIFLDDTIQLDQFRIGHKQVISEINQTATEKMDDTSFVFDGRTEPWQRKIILEQAVDHKKPIFSMYCLDEGIDVPEFQGAILVASASSERQYIQRRGRILRGGTKGKIADLYDIIVFPELQESVTVNDTARKIIENELKRVAELSNDALNKYEVIINVNSYLKKVGFDITF